jgi:hypothetical protein
MFTIEVTELHALDMMERVVYAGLSVAHRKPDGGGGDRALRE